MILPTPTPRPRQERTPQRLLRALLGVWDRLAIYLPLTLMGVLALITYWMVRITPQLSEPQAPRTATNEVDFFMRGAVMKTYDQNGRLQNQLTGGEMRHYSGSASVEIDQARWWSKGLDGRITLASAQQARSKDDGSEVQLMGQAVVVREALQSPTGKPLPRIEFRGEFLQIFANDERLTSHLPVLILSGDDRFSGDSFRYDHIERRVEFTGRARAVLVPDATAKPTGKATGKPSNSRARR